MKTMAQRKRELMARLRGQQFHAWKVIAYSERRDGTHYVKIRCVCGFERATRIQNLGQSRSCGCQTNEILSEEETALLASRRNDVRDLRQRNRSYYLYELARKRSEVRGGLVEFTLRPVDITVPEFCPVMGHRLESGEAGKKSPVSPTLLRTNLRRPWERGNVTVLSWEGAMQVERARALGTRARVEPIDTMTPEELLLRKEQMVLHNLWPTTESR